MMVVLVISGRGREGREGKVGSREGKEREGKGKNMV